MQRPGPARPQAATRAQTEAAQRPMRVQRVQLTGVCVWGAVRPASCSAARRIAQHASHGGGGGRGCVRVQRTAATRERSAVQCAAVVDTWRVSGAAHTQRQGDRAKGLLTARGTWMAGRGGGRPSRRAAPVGRRCLTFLRCCCCRTAAAPPQRDKGARFGRTTLKRTACTTSQTARPARTLAPPPPLPQRQQRRAGWCASPGHPAAAHAAFPFPVLVLLLLPIPVLLVLLEVVLLRLHNHLRNQPTNRSTDHQTKQRAVQRRRKGAGSAPVA